MRDEIDTPGGRPCLTWVPAVDARGRTHMEARWSTGPSAPPSVAPSASAAHHAA